MGNIVRNVRSSPRVLDYRLLRGNPAFPLGEYYYFLHNNWPYEDVFSKGSLFSFDNLVTISKTWTYRMYRQIPHFLLTHAHAQHLTNWTRHLTPFKAHKCPLNVAIQENCYKVITRWYRTPSRLQKFPPPFPTLVGDVGKWKALCFIYGEPLQLF